MCSPTVDAKFWLQIIIGGDSAGANLVLGLLSHALHPHSNIQPLNLSAPFRSATLLSPWGKFSTEADSYKRNAYTDLLSGDFLSIYAEAFMGDAPVDAYNQPFTAENEWWKGLESVVEDMLITAGTQEILVDDIKDFVSRITVSDCPTQWKNFPQGY